MVTDAQRRWVETRPGYFHAYYLRNKDRYIENAQRRRAVLQGAIRWYKMTHPCIDCGEDDPLVLDFDHVRGRKVFTLGTDITKKLPSLKKLLTEIHKCEVACANCHRRRSARRQNA